MTRRTFFRYYSLSAAVLGLDACKLNLLQNALANPSAPSVVPLRNQAIATSGNYRKYFKDDQGRLYSHILDPRTGQPVTHSLVSVSAVADTCLRADALATALFVMGYEEGREWIQTQTNASAFFIFKTPEGSLKQSASAGFPKWTEPAR